MRFRFKIAPVVLIAAMVSGFWAQPGFSASFQLLEPSSGCHGHNHSSRAPQKTPVHDCCLTGHDVALPQLSSATPPPAQCRQFAGSASALLATITTLDLPMPLAISSTES